MCGLAAALLKTSADARHVAAQAVGRMCERMKARGPDAEGSWSDPQVPLALGHRRLAVIDLDARANQPMMSSDERFAIVFNGEIYNYRELRRQLSERGDSLRTHSDTEVVLGLYARHGAEMLPKLRGMFAFAIWDRQRKQLFVARDPYGIKPLFIATTTEGVLVASQVKALLSTGLVSMAPDAVGQASFWLRGSVSEPHTWFRDIRCLQAGSYALISDSGQVRVTQWHDIGEEWRTAGTAQVSDEEARDCARKALRASIESHLVADVPIGVLLSGGIDSSAVASLMRDAGARGLQGITLAFEEFAHTERDEAPVAARFASDLGIAHHVRTVRRGEFERDLPRILAAMDQPSVDGINTWYASKAVSEVGLKVAVSGVGGDELFHGYSSFRELPRLVDGWRRLSRVPGTKTLAKVVARAQARRSRNARWNLMPELLCSIEGAWFMRRGLFGPEELPRLMGPELAAVALQNFDPTQSVRAMTGALAGDHRVALAQIESMTYLRNQLLRDSDWASMDHSVELRTPLVDSWLLRELRPVLGAFGRFRNKELLAQAPSRPLREYVTARKKTGFGIPVQQWLRAMERTHSMAGMSRSWAIELTHQLYASV